MSYSATSFVYNRHYNLYSYCVLRIMLIHDPSETVNSMRNSHPNNTEHTVPSEIIMAAAKLATTGINALVQGRENK